MENKADKNLKQKAVQNSKVFMPRYMWVILYILIVALMLVGVYLIVAQYVFIADRPYETPPEYTTIPDHEHTPAVETEAPDEIAPTLEPTLTTELTPEPEPIVPVQITFTTQKVQCEVQTVGRKDNNEMGTVDSATIAAWFNESAAPNQSGNCVINGHVSQGGKKGAFSYLMEMEEGDEIVLKLEDDSYRYYEVLYIEEHPYTEVPQYHMAKSGRDRLTLITCTGDWGKKAGTHLMRQVVVCMPKVENQ